MKSMLLLFLLAPAVLLAQDTNSVQKIPSAQAKDHLEENAVVVGTIAEINQAEKLVRLNFEQPFPKQTFTAVVFASKTNLFPNFDQLKGKTVEVSGKITAYHERPQIVLNSTNQLKVVGPPATRVPEVK
jgi:DNA/RNA endonuclease YhcR with UshA esterase domain